jgi:hypothetical protein
VLLVVINPFGSVDISVLNDTGADLTISACVDDSAGVDAGDTFRAYGIPDDDHLSCLVVKDEHERCVAIPHAHELRDAVFPLSRAVSERMSKC